MRIVNVLEAAVPLSRYADPAIASGDLDTSVVAVITDVIRGGRPVVGLGYGSVGRYAQGGLIRARFAPRLLQAPDGACADASTGNLDPALAWRAMMAGEKPGGHGERCVAVGALDMAIWDAAAKIADEPLCRHIARRRGRRAAGPRAGVRGRRLSLSARRRGPPGGRGAGLRRAGVQPDQDQDRRRGSGRRSPPHRDGIGAAAHGRRPGGGCDERLRTRQRAGGARALSGYGLWWFEDICDPLDFETLADVAASYPSPIAAGEAHSRRRRRACWRGMAACVRIAMYWSSIPRIATA